MTFRANAEGTLNMLWAAREAGVERILTVGSADVYGKVTPAELPLTELSPLRPVSPYAASKVAADTVAQQAFLGFGQHVVRARPFNHLGPGQTTRFVAPALAERIARNELHRRGRAAGRQPQPARDFTDVRDVVRAYRLLVGHGRAGDVYNVCSGEAIAVEDLALQLLGHEHDPQALVADPELQRPVDIPVLLGDSSKLRDETGWSAPCPWPPRWPTCSTTCAAASGSDSQARPGHSPAKGHRVAIGGIARAPDALELPPIRA